MAGSVMPVGFVNVPGIVMGIDDQATAPLWLLAAGPCWAGTYPAHADLVPSAAPVVTRPRPQILIGSDRQKRPDMPQCAAATGSAIRAVE